MENYLSLVSFYLKDIFDGSGVIYLLLRKRPTKTGLLTAQTNALAIAAFINSVYKDGNIYAEKNPLGKHGVEL